jgi:hypothetical protein
MPNKWLGWTPDRDEIIPEGPMREPSKPSVQGFDGSEAQPRGLFPIIQGKEENPRSVVDTIEKARGPAPSKPSEPPNDSAQAHAHDILADLSGRPAACSPTCYEIEPGKWIHHPWDGCETPIRGSAEPIIPACADCGCAGKVCSRCWLCAKVHCRCLPKNSRPVAVTASDRTLVETLILLSEEAKS